MGLRREALLGFRSANKAHGNADDRGGRRRPLVEHFEQSKQRRRRVTDGDDSAFQMRPPKLQRRGRSGVSDIGRELGYGGGGARRMSTRRGEGEVGRVARRSDGKLA